MQSEKASLQQLPLGTLLYQGIWTELLLTDLFLWYNSGVCEMFLDLTMNFLQGQNFCFASLSCGHCFLHEREPHGQAVLCAI